MGTAFEDFNQWLMYCKLTCKVSHKACHVLPLLFLSEYYSLPSLPLVKEEKCFMSRNVFNYGEFEVCARRERKQREGLQ